MLYLAHWARKLSWKETAQSLHTSWEKVQHAVAYVVQWGLDIASWVISGPSAWTNRLRSCHEYLTLVYQNRGGCTGCSGWVRSAPKNVPEVLRSDRHGCAQKIEFVCSDMWKTISDMIKLHCTGALNILDRFTSVPKLNLPSDESCGRSTPLVKDGYEPVLRSRGWCLLKRPGNLTDSQRIKLREVLPL